jgi:hypothetical protein
MRKWIIFFSAIAVAITAQSISVRASDTEWDRTVLPRPPQPFEGVYGTRRHDCLFIFNHRRVDPL